MSLRVFLENISIWTGRVRKAGDSPQCRGVPSNLLRVSMEQKDEGRLDLLSLCLTAWAGTSIFSCFLLSWFSGPKAWIDWNLHQYSLVLRPLNYASSFSGSPTCRWQIMELLTLHNQYLISLPSFLPFLSFFLSSFLPSFFLSIYIYVI
jgi:hypothetical protein